MWSIFCQPRLFSSLIILAIFSALQAKMIPSGFCSSAFTTSGPNVTASVGTSTGLSTLAPASFRPATCASAIIGHGPNGSTNWMTCFMSLNCSAQAFARGGNRFG